MNRNDSSDSPWTLLGSIIGLVLVARVAIGLMASAPPLLVIALACGAIAIVGFGVVGGRPSGVRLGRFLRALRRAPKPLSGEVRWATRRDLKRAGWTGTEGWPIGVYRALWGLRPITVRIPDRDQTLGALLMATVGQGKTASVLIPAVQSEAQIADERRRHSLILLDPKGDVWDACRNELQRSHECWVWNPSAPERSTVAFDSLAWVPSKHSDPRFQEAVDTVAKIYLAATAGDETGPTGSYVTDPFWPRMVGSVLKGVLLHLRSTNPAFTMLDVADYLSETTPEDMVRHLTTHPKTRAAYLRGAVMRELLHNERIRGACISDLAERIVLLTDPRLRVVMREDTLPLFDLNRFLARPSVLVLQVGALGDIMLPLLSVVTATIQTELVRRTRDGGTLGRGVRFLLDEAGVIGRIHNLDNGIAMLRSANVGYLVTIQTRDQLVANYGEHKAKTIVKNLTHRFVLGGTTDEDAAWICGNLGKRAAYRDLPGTNPEGQESWHYTREEWPLLRPDELRHLRYEMVVDSSHVPPLKLRLRHYANGRKGKGGA